MRLLVHPTISFLISPDRTVYLVVVLSSSLISAYVVNSYSLCSLRLNGLNSTYKLSVKMNIGDRDRVGELVDFIKFVVG